MTGRPGRAAVALASTLALLAAFGCDSWLTKPSMYGQFEVITRNQNGDPMPGRPLVLYTGARPMGYATTDSSGRFLFTRVPQGQYGVTVERPPGYTDFVTPGDSQFTSRDNLTLQAGATDSVIFVLVRCLGTLAATVVDQNASPVSNAFVRAYSSSQALDSGYTGADGRISFAGLPCAIDLGLQVGVSTAYTVTGPSYFDGLRVTLGKVIAVAFHVRRPP